jgi:hypothetical protein
MKFIIFTLVIIASSLGTSAQKNKGIVMRGYVFSFNDNRVFCPSKDSLSPVSAINDRAFLIGTQQDRNERLIAALNNVGDSITVKILDSNGNSLGAEVWHYFYCDVGLIFSVGNDTDFEIWQPANYRVSYMNKVMDFWGIWIRNEVVYLKPLKEKFDRQIRKYYQDSGIGIPRYLWN